MQTTAMPRRSPNILGPNRDDDGSCAAACEQTVQFGVVRRWMDMCRSHCGAVYQMVLSCGDVSHEIR
jgi:hypothetical protein